MRQRRSGNSLGKPCFENGNGDFNFGEKDLSRDRLGVYRNGRPHIGRASQIIAQLLLELWRKRISSPQDAFFLNWLNSRAKAGWQMLRKSNLRWAVTKIAATRQKLESFTPTVTPR